MYQDFHFDFLPHRFYIQTPPFGAVRHANYCVIDTGSGSEALALRIRAARRPEPVITDLRLPGMRGSTLWRGSCSNGNPVSHANLSEGDELLSKPFTLDALLRKVNELLIGSRTGLREQRDWRPLLGERLNRLSSVGDGTSNAPRDYVGVGVRLFCLFLPWVLGAQTATYEIQPAQGSRFALEVFKSKLWEGKKHTFVFDRFSGALSFDREQPERLAVRFVVETGSVRCVDDWVKPKQIKDIEKAARDLMAAETYPEITFQSKTIKVKSCDQYEVRGLLTIRSQTKPVTLTFQATPRESEILADGSGRLKLSDFGLKLPKVVPGVSLFIGTKDEMTVLFGILAKKQ